MSAAVDLDAIHQVASEVDATRRLVAVAGDLVEEILDRHRRIVERIDVLAGDNPEIGSPTTLDRVMDLSRIGDLYRDLLAVADQICVALDDEPPSVLAGFSQMMLEQLDEKAALRAELEAARSTAD